MKRIIYQTPKGTLAVITPVMDCGISVQEIARKDVPAGNSFLILDTDTMPQDYMFFSAWEADFTTPDGYGIGAEAWFAEQADKETV